MDQIGLIRQLMALRPQRYLFGGWAEDALLHGRSSRPHDDIDLMVRLEDLDGLLDQVEGLGFDQVHVKFALERNKPIVVAAYSHGFELELIVHQVDASGRAFFDLPFEGQGVRRVFLPPGSFDHPPSQLEGVEVRTISPLALYQIREASQHVFGGFREKDKVTQAALRARFFAKTPAKELQPLVA